MLDVSTMQSRRRDHTYTRPRAATLEIHALPKLRWCRAVEDVFSCSDAGEYGMMLSMTHMNSLNIISGFRMPIRITVPGMGTETDSIMTAVVYGISLQNGKATMIAEVIL